MIKNKKTLGNFLITGSSSGIGLEIANKFLKNNANVVFHSKEKHDFSIIKKSEYYYGDLSKQEHVDELFEKIKHINLDGIICCAGRTHLYPTDDNCLNFNKNEFLKVFDNIFFSTVLLCQKFIPKMIEKKFGKIVIIGGDVVDKPNQKGEMCSYAVSKSAVHQYAKYLSQQLRKFNIYVNVVAPTGVIKENINETDKLERKATKQEIANTVLFLCSEKNFINGEIIRINGGRINY